MLRLITLALLGHVALSAISFNGISNCRTKTSMMPASDGSMTYFASYAEVNDMNVDTEDYIPLEHTGYDNGY